MIVVDDLVRYTGRVAISNAHIEAVKDHGVTLHQKGYRQGEFGRTRTLVGAECVSRFLLRELPQVPGARVPLRLHR